MAPTRLHLKRDEKLTVEWPDGHTGLFPIAELRRACPCAVCKDLRKQLTTNRLTIVPAGDDRPVTVDRVERVGNYAIRPIWSDGHATGIYSFAYLRELSEGVLPPIGETWPRH